jgi:hypothetical protein
VILDAIFRAALRRGYAVTELDELPRMPIWVSPTLTANGGFRAG